MKPVISSHLKIIQPANIPSLKRSWEEKKQKIVFTNGCFDIIHRGHVEYLEKSSELGDIFFIGLNSDESVRKLKGEKRPFQDQESRAIILAAFGFVDHVCIFNEDTPYELIKLIQPDVIVKGSDYNPEEIVGNDIVKAKGGQVVTIELVKGYSSSGIINRLPG